MVLRTTVLQFFVCFTFQPKFPLSSLLPVSDLHIQPSVHSSARVSRDMVCKVAVILSTSPCLKETQKSVKEKETGPAPTLRSPTRIPSYTTIYAEDLGQTHTGFMIIKSPSDPVIPV